MSDKKPNTFDMSSLTASLNTFTVPSTYQRPKGKITRNIPYEKELEAKKNGTYVNTYTAADDKKLRDYCHKQGYKGNI